MARAVRISRGSSPAPAGSPGGDEDPSQGYRANTAALTRSSRLFGLFVVVLLVSFGVFVARLEATTAATSPVIAPSLLFLSAMAVLVVVVAFALTLGRTPRGIERGDGKLVVIEFLGHRRIFPLDGSFRPTVENRYPAGALAPAPTEMVELRSARGPARHYLLARELVPEPLG